MAKETTYEEIARELKNRIYKPVYYLMGEESYESIVMTATLSGRISRVNADAMSIIPPPESSPRRDHPPHRRSPGQIRPPCAAVHVASG